MIGREELFRAEWTHLYWEYPIVGIKLTTYGWTGVEWRIVLETTVRCVCRSTLFEYRQGQNEECCPLVTSRSDLKQTTKKSRSQWPSNGYTVSERHLSRNWKFIVESSKAHKNESTGQMECHCSVARRTLVSRKGFRTLR